MTPPIHNKVLQWEFPFVSLVLFVLFVLVVLFVLFEAANSSWDKEDDLFSVLVLFVVRYAGVYELEEEDRLAGGIIFVFHALPLSFKYIKKIQIEKLF